jgi:hypothetical protein
MRRRGKEEPRTEADAGQKLRSMKADPVRVCGARLAPRPPAVRSGDASIVSPQNEHIRQVVASKITFRAQDKSLGGSRSWRTPGARSACAHTQFIVLQLRVAAPRGQIGMSMSTSKRKASFPKRGRGAVLNRPRHLVLDRAPLRRPVRTRPSGVYVVSLIDADSLVDQACHATV